MKNQSKSFNWGRLALIFILVALLAACQLETAQTEQSRIRLEPCHLSAPGLPLRLPAQCGKLEVYEDRAAQAGRTLELNIAVISAISRSPQPDPLFFLTGGPGQAATESYLSLSRAFNSIAQNRDIVLVDQRGTGQSNPLTCSQDGEIEQTVLSDEALEALVNSCRAEIETRANPALYTTAIAMDDLDQVRAALGYEQINLYGVSYGTRAALTYLQRYPERVRAVILDGVVPQDEALGLNMARDAQRALDLLFERCAADPACQATFPDLETEFAGLLQSLEQEPSEVRLPHPTTGEPTTLTFNPEMLATAVRLLSYSQETMALLPLLIHTAAEQDDYTLLAAQYLIVAEQLGESISTGMSHSVICSEDLPFFTPEQAANASAGTYLGTISLEALFTICEIWPHTDAPSEFKQAVVSDVPALLLSGEMDPVTPPENAEQAAQTLPNSLHLVAAGQGHNVVYRGCFPNLITRFIEAGTVEGLDTACVAEIEPMSFFINFAGPQP